MTEFAENYIIQTVSRALDLLEQFQEGDAELGLIDLTSRLNLQKNNVFRLVATLKARNYIEVNNSTGKYRLGIKTRALGQIATRQVDFAYHARPYLSELKQQCHETCYFSVIKDGYTCYIDGVESDLPVRVTQRLGSSRPLYCTAAGRVHLAYMDRQKQMELVSGSELKQLTARTITDPDLLKSELDKVAQQGYAIDDQEHDAGVMEIATPVFDTHGAVIGALSISGPEMRLSGLRLENELLPLLCQSAKSFSNALGNCRTEAALTEISLQSPKPKRKTRKLETKPYVFGGLKTYC
ncbi:MAG: IclR family transcriptional regulator [Desulfuromonadales bacterium]|nr:IclR family transcriptional regulator [Desulfuromonadales bacterium]